MKQKLIFLKGQFKKFITIDGDFNNPLAITYRTNG